MTTGVVNPVETSIGVDLVDLLVQQNRVVAHEQARLLRLVHQVVNAAPDPRFGVDEVAFALTWTRQAAATQEHLARQLIVDLPEVITALEAGRIDMPKARVFADVLGVLDGEVARQIAAEVLPVAHEKTTGQLRDRLQRRALAADPEHARKRRERGQAERRVILEAADDGTASLSAFGLAPHRAAAAFERVTAIAKVKKLAGAMQTMDQLRADVLLDLLEGVDIGAIPGSRRGVVELTVGLETLAGLNSNPGALAGHGPVAADIARQCAMSGLDYQWRFSVRDDQTGELLFQGLTRARPADPGPARHQPAPPRNGAAQRRQGQTAPLRPARAGSAERHTPSESAPRQAASQRVGGANTGASKKSAPHRPTPAPAENTNHGASWTSAPQPPAPPRAEGANRGAPWGAAQRERGADDRKRWKRDSSAAGPGCPVPQRCHGPLDHEP